MNVTPRQLTESLRSTVCPACGDGKKAKQTLCRGCYFACSAKVRKALYNPLGDGYESAVARAFEELDRGTFQMPEWVPPAHDLASPGGAD